MGRLTAACGVAAPRHRYLFALAALACVASCSSHVQPDDTGHGVLLIVIDGLRADHVGNYGYDRDTTPELDVFAKESVAFDNAFSAAPWVVPSYASMFTGCDPYVARRVLPPDIPASLATLWHIPDAAPLFAQQLLRNGWDTAAFLDHPMMVPVYGFARGFQTFDAMRTEPNTPREAYGVNAVTTRFENWLADRRAGANWFAMLEISDLERVWNETDEQWDTYFAPRPELGYVPPVGDASRIFFAIPRSRWMGGMHTLGEYEAEYDGALRRLDQRLGRLFHTLRAQGWLERTHVIVTSSFGVGFGEAGLLLDHGTLTDVDLHVPLIVRTPSSYPSARGTRTPALASSIDIAPTVLNFAEVAQPSSMQGASLDFALHGLAGPPQRCVFARCGVQEGMAVIDQRWCFESTSPWKAEDRTLAQSWYGGTPTTLEPREVLHDRSHRGNLGHASSAPLDAAVVGPMREAGQAWETQVEKMRRMLHATDWLEDHKVETPQPAGERSDG